MLVLLGGTATHRQPVCPSAPPEHIVPDRPQALPEAPSGQRVSLMTTGGISQLPHWREPRRQVQVMVPMTLHVVVQLVVHAPPCAHAICASTRLSTGTRVSTGTRLSTGTRVSAGTRLSTAGRESTRGRVSTGRRVSGAASGVTERVSIRPASVGPPTLSSLVWPSSRRPSVDDPASILSWAEASCSLGDSNSVRPPTQPNANAEVATTIQVAVRRTMGCSLSRVPGAVCVDKGQHSPVPHIKKSPP